jgi:hemerythrin
LPDSSGSQLNIYVLLGDSMQKTHWNESLRVDISEHDERVIKFYEYIDKLSELVAMRRKKEFDFENIAEALADVSEYSRFHFAQEEKQLVKNMYPEIANHKKAHKRFLKKVMAFRRILSEEPERASTDSLDYILSWLENHIKECDMRFAPYIRVNKYLNDYQQAMRRGRA